MTSRATTLRLVDAALVSKYTGTLIYTGTPPVITPVSVFMESPDPELAKERVFPSISIKYTGMFPDYMGMQHCDDGDAEFLSMNEGVTPPVNIMRESPIAYRIQYSIDTWHKHRFVEDRDLLFETFLRKTKIRGYLTVKNIDDENIDVWLQWEGGVVVADEVDIDEVICHKSLSVSVLAYLSPVEDSEVSSVKVVTDVEFEVNSYEDGISTKDAAFEVDSVGMVRRVDD